MKRYLPIFLILSLVLSAFAWVTLGDYEFGRAQTPQIGQSQEADDALRHTVSVSGSGRISVEPDTARVRLGVQSEAETAQEALEQNNLQMQSVLDSLNEAGIDSEDIQTQFLNLNPRYETQTSDRTLVGYTVFNIVEVRFRDLEGLGALLDEAVQSGANTIENISFEISDPTSALDQARELAMVDARHKAEMLASLSNAGLGTVLSINESSARPSPVPGEVVLEEAAGAVPVQTGRETITVNLQVTWLLNVDMEGSSGESGMVLISPDDGPPGTEVEVIASNLPADTDVDIGVGRWRSEYDLVDSTRTDADGSLDTQVTIPSYAEGGERWVVVVAAADQPGFKVRSNVFSILE